jgi:hypothetical protein
LTEVKTADRPFCDTGIVKMALQNVAPAVVPPIESKIVTARFADKRLAREWKTIEAMIRCYCRDRHNADSGLCAECRQLFDYAGMRLERCRFGTEKPTCANCPVHCYQRARREQVKVVMRYAGPRMLWRHPILSLYHWLDGFRKAPAL